MASVKRLVCTKAIHVREHGEMAGVRPCPVNLLRTCEGQVSGVSRLVRERGTVGLDHTAELSSGQMVSQTEAEPLSVLGAPELAATSQELGYLVATQ